jgi:hypothetical protein
MSLLCILFLSLKIGVTIPGLRSSWARMLPWTFIFGLHMTRSCCCAEGPCSFVQDQKQDGRRVSRPRSSATAFAASSRAGYTCWHEIARLCDMKPGDVERTMDAISNLHKRRCPTEKASPDTINNGSTPTPTTSLHRVTSGHHERHRQWLLQPTPTMLPHQGGEPKHHA